MSFDERRLSDPGYFSENRLSAHSDHIPYADTAEADAGETSLRVSLNGYWKFFHAMNPKQIIPGFEADDYDCRPWAEIPVPAHIQTEGYGHPQYCNIQYPWDGTDDIDIGQMPEYFNPVACYAKYFMLPAGWEGKRVIISFQGVESCVALWLNGHYVGFASDSFTPDEFDLTEFLRPGENKLACRVYRWNVSSWLEDQDFMRFSGIFRDVYLQMIPEVHIAHIELDAIPTTDLKTGSLTGMLKLDAPEGAKVGLCLKDGGSVIAKETLNARDGEVAVGFAVAEPKLWSSEVPNLYTLEIEAIAPDGGVCEVVRQRIGFRRFEIIDSVMYLNGVRIVFKGTDRHDFCGETGRAVTAEKIRRDLVTMKRNNINAIRTSHYPNSSVLYRYADELGLYIIDECNLETHDIWNDVATGRRPLEECLPGDRKEYLPMMLDRVTSLTQRDRNHACVLLWSCGNESYGGTVILEMSRYFKKLDPTRLVHYEGVHWDPRYPETTDVYSQMYTPAADVRRFVREHTDKPMILCEYVHSMGNANGAVHKYTQLAYEEPRYQGGFIWDFIDQGIRTKDRWGNVMYGYGGDFDDRPNDGNFSGNGVTFADGTETPKLQEVRYCYRNIEAEIGLEAALIRNRNMFVRTSAFDCVAILARNGKEIARARIDTDIAPLNEETVKLPFGVQTAGGEYAVTLSFRLKEDTAWADAGFEVAYDQGIWTVASAPAAKACPPLRTVRGPHNLGIYGNGFAMMFSLEQCRLISFRAGGQELLKVGPMPNFWRAPVDDDYGNGMPARYAQWKIASMYLSPTLTDELRKRNYTDQVTLHEDGSVSVRFIYGLPVRPAAECCVTYTVAPSGRVTVHMTYDPAEGLGDMPEFGMLFRLNADYDRVRYYGLGPDENYSDRHEGGKLGIWETDTRKNFTPYLLPQECGNRTGVRWAEVTDYKGRGIRFIGDGMEFSALPWTPHEIENALHACELPPVQYTVVRAMKKQMGIAGDNAWGARTHDEYLLDVSGRVEFTFAFESVL